MSAHPKQWTPDEDARLREAYEAGLSWEEIAAGLQVSRFAAVARGQRIGCIRKALAKVAPPHRDVTARNCYPPGHPATWLPIIAGTLLEGVLFPAV